LPNTRKAPPLRKRGSRPPLGKMGTQLTLRQLEKVRRIPIRQLTNETLVSWDAGTGVGPLGTRNLLATLGRWSSAMDADIGRDEIAALKLLVNNQLRSSPGWSDAVKRVKRARSEASFAALNRLDLPMVDFLRRLGGVVGGLVTASAATAPRSGPAQALMSWALAVISLAP